MKHRNLKNQFLFNSETLTKRTFGLFLIDIIISCCLFLFIFLSLVFNKYNLSKTNILFLKIHDYFLI